MTKPDYFNPLHIARMHHHLQYAQCTSHSMDHKTMWQINFQIFLLRFPTKCWIFYKTVAWALGSGHSAHGTASDWDWQASWHSALQQTQRLNVGEQDTLSIGLLPHRSLDTAGLYPYPQHWRLWSVHCPVFPLFFTDCEPGDFLSVEVEVDTLTL